MKTEISQRWSELIENTGKTKMEIAALAGVNKSNITNYCSGRYKAKQETIYNVCQPLGINPSWLMGYDVPMTLPLDSAPAPASSPALPLSEEETRLVGLYRTATDYGRGLAIGDLKNNQKEEAASSRSAV